MERDQARRLIMDLLKRMASTNGSDLFITAGFPPALKVDGKISPVGDRPLTPEQSNVLVRSIMNDRQTKEFDSTKECNFSINPKRIGRFRVNVFVQQAQVGAVIRMINTKIPSFDELELPPIMQEIVMAKRGLVMVVGGPGSGTTTRPAASFGCGSNTPRL